MAKIERFEEIISWKEARELNKVIGKFIDEERFKKSYRLINQIEGSAGSIMITLPRVLKEEETKSLFNSCI
jgi:hypothetical protein